MRKKTKNKAALPVFKCSEHGTLTLDQVTIAKPASGGIPGYGCSCKQCERIVALRITGDVPRCDKCDIGLNIHTSTWTYNRRSGKWVHNCKLWRSVNVKETSKKTSKKSVKVRRS